MVTEEKRTPGLETQETRLKPHLLSLGGGVVRAPAPAVIAVFNVSRWLGAVAVMLEAIWLAREYLGPNDGKKLSFEPFLFLHVR